MRKRVGKSERKDRRRKKCIKSNCEKIDLNRPHLSLDGETKATDQPDFNSFHSFLFAATENVVFGNAFLSCLWEGNWISAQHFCLVALELPLIRWEEKWRKVEAQYVLEQ